MKKILLFIGLTCLSGCVTRTVYRDPPPIPPLPTNISTPCPGLPDVINKASATLADADTAAAYLYAACQDKHNSAVKQYEVVRTAREQYEKAKSQMKK